MTAYRVVIDHEELDNSGEVTHSDLDNYINNSPFVVASGSVGPIPPSARKLKAGPGILITDTGPGGDLIITSTTTTSVSWMEIPSGSINGTNRDFALANTPVPLSSLMYFVNGVLQRQGAICDYEIVSGNIIQSKYDYLPGTNLFATYPF